MRTKGFTLIELLVVVLIIGILAAVALPQYQTAVAKTRLMELYSLGLSLRRAQEVYYMSNDQYAVDFFNLDIDFTKTCKLKEGDNSLLLCPFARFDNIGATNTPDKSFVCIYFYSKGWDGVTLDGADLKLYIYYAHSTYPNKIACNGATDLGRRLCKNIDL